MEKIIEVRGLRKSYGEVQAVRGIDFYVEKGKMFALLGPNGAGKSTTIDMLCTFLKPDAGEAVVDGLRLGRDDAGIRRRIGAVFQDNLLDPLLTVEENLRARGGLYGLSGRALDEAVEKAAADVGVTGILKRPYGKLSGGQRRRCDITRALVHKPDVLFLDEPTTGLDPQTRMSVWETIRGFQKQYGMTLFLTTHYMEEAAGADYVIIIDEGSIAAKGTPSQLEEEYTADKLTLVCADPEQVTRILDARGLAYRQVAETLTLSVATSLEALPVIEACRPHLAGFEVTRGSMDDVFLAVTGKEIRE
ncbi:MAG TPA: ABC transporter ATP-binding protein [Candidatus Limnocylindria bacterium]|nr:ABC transporter ATP-binding protein [Candidatus Limnocylindria bacterium]